MSLLVEVRVGTTELLAEVARDLASAKPDVIIAVGGAAIRAIKKAGVNTPIVGGFIGGVVLNFLGVGGAVTGLNIVSILTAFVGAIILLALLRVIRRA